nr:cache domain-containing protein [Bacteriovorax sp. HI3]
MKFFLSLMLSTFLMAGAFAEALTPEQTAALNKQVEEMKKLASDPKVVDAVKAVNATALADYKDMTQDKWKDLPVLDPKVRYFSKNPAGEYLKTKKNDMVTEIFVNAADGTKVAFLSKTSNWSHKGKPKHDDPMAGKTWQGSIEMDESTGLKSIQVAVPVMDGGKPIGSMTVGYSITKLK